MSNTNEDEEVKKSTISETLIEALTSFYSPAQSLEDSDECKSTRELISEMADIEDISSYEVNRLMEERGFIIRYDGQNYVWLLKTK